jgi:O-antigen ligase
MKWVTEQRFVNREANRPWLGIGVGSTPALEAARGVAEQPKGFVMSRTTGSHSHDLFLQTWYELGAVGVVLVAVAGAAAVL